MQQFFIFLALMFTSLMIGQVTEPPSDLTGNRITATVVDIKSERGLVHFALYDKDNFMIKPIQAASAKISQGTSTIVFEVREKGQYAILCFHDTNDNNRMDFDERGIPVEDYGVSNNSYAYGPPNFDTAKFDVGDKDLLLEIKF